MVFKLSNIKAFILEKLTPKLLHKIKSISVFFSRALGSFKTLQHKEAPGFKKKKKKATMKPYNSRLSISETKGFTMQQVLEVTYTAIHEGVPPRQSLFLLNFKYQPKLQQTPLLWITMIRQPKLPSSIR